MKFNTRHYEMNHGAKPRGQGNWGFCPEAQYESKNPAVNYLDHVKWFQGTLTEAKRQAAAAFKGNASTLVVCP